MKEERILCRLLQINKELECRKQKNKLLTYNSGKLIHKKQLEFHKCQKRNRWVFGGNRSGKTECGAVESVWMCLGTHPYRQNRNGVIGWVVSLSQQVQRDVAQRKILNYLDRNSIVDIIMLNGKKTSPENGVIDQIILKNKFGTHSILGFKSCDQGREKFQGTSLDFVWFDEEPPQDIYIECLMRVIDKQGDIFGTMTPLKGLTWVYEDIYLKEGIDDNIWCEFMEWDDNPYLSKDEIKILTQSLSKDQLEARKYGRFQATSGLVYPEFDPSIHIIEPFNVPKEWYDKISIDPGLHNPLSAHFYAVDYDGNVYVIAEHYEAERDVQYHANAIKAIANRLDWHRNSNGMIEALIDAAATSRTLGSNKSVVELFYEQGILTNPKVNKDLFSGIARVKKYLRSLDGRAKLFIFSNCVKLIYEIKKYWWGNGDNPIKKDDHALDELRYYIMSRPEPAMLKVEKTEIQKDKERLLRRIKREQRKI